MISLLSSIWRRIIGSYLLWNSFFGLTVICPFNSEIPRSDQQYQYQQIKAKCGFIFKHICNEHLFIKTGFFFFWFGLVCFTFYLEGGVDGFFLFILMSDLWYFFLSFNNRHIHVNTKHVKSKQDAKVPRRSQEKKSQRSIVCWLLNTKYLNSLVQCILIFKDFQFFVTYSPVKHWASFVVSRFKNKI